jgi:Adenylate and Guanylate cyclase catalytic domain
MELRADRDPEEARKLLDPVLELMLEAVHRYEGTVNQVMGDGIMALFGAPLAHEDHAVRACYAALRMREQVKAFAEEIRRSHAAVVKKSGASSRHLNRVDRTSRRTRADRNALPKLKTRAISTERPIVHIVPKHQLPPKILWPAKLCEGTETVVGSATPHLP